jgi:hypothetical protein
LTPGAIGWPVSPEAKFSYQPLNFFVVKPDLGSGPVLLTGFKVKKHYHGKPD